MLAEAADAGVPPLERCRFLSIFESNLDEFYMVRVSGLIEQVESGVLELRMTASANKATPEFAAFSGLSVPMLIDGPWRLPKFAFDFGAASGSGGAMPSKQHDAAAEPTPPTQASVAVSALVPRAAALRAGR